MGYVVGSLLGLVTCAFARAVGFDRDRAFYPTVLIVVASFYVLFAVMGGSPRALVLELAVMSVFVVIAVAGFKGNLWLVVAGIAAHGVMDFFVHGRIVANAGMPAWWPAFCGSFDIAMPACLVWLSSTGLWLTTRPTVSGSAVE
ncbi:MAG: hypothetical protein AB7N65_28290 [Vicinamibacterales bacterium]